MKVIAASFAFVVLAIAQEADALTDESVLFAPHTPSRNASAIWGVRSPRNASSKSSAIRGPRTSSPTSPPTHAPTAPPLPSRGSIVVDDDEPMLAPERLTSAAGCSAIMAPLPIKLRRYLRDLQVLADSEGSPWFIVGGHALHSIRTGSPISYYDRDKRFQVWSDGDIDAFVILPNATYLERTWVPNVIGRLKEKWPGIHMSKTDLRKKKEINVWKNPGFPGKKQKILQPVNESPHCAAVLTFYPCFVHNATHVVKKVYRRGLVYVPSSLYLPVKYVQYGHVLRMPVPNDFLYAAGGGFRDARGEVGEEIVETRSAREAGNSPGAIGCKRASYPNFVFETMHKLQNASNCERLSLKCQACPENLDRGSWFSRQELATHFASCAQSMADRGLASYISCKPELDSYA